MAASLPRSEIRLFRTYGAAGGGGPRRRPGRAAAQWFPPQNRNGLFSSDTSSGSPSQPEASDDSDDPDFPGSPVSRRRRRPGRGVSKQQPTLIATPRRLRLRARPPLKCSTPYCPLRPPRFPSSRGGRLSDFSECSQPKDHDELGLSASLISPRPSSGPGPPAPGDSIISTCPSASSDATSANSSGFHLSSASLNLASPPRSQETATEGISVTSMVHRAHTSLTSALSSLMDSRYPVDRECGTHRKNTESCCKRKVMGNRLEGTGKKRVTGRDSSQKRGSQRATLIDSEEATGCRGHIIPRKINRPKRTRPRQKRKHQEAGETSPLHHHRFKKSQKMGKDSFLSQDLTHLPKSCSWTKIRASFNFHKKKIVTDVSEVSSIYTISSSPSKSFVSECSNPPVLNTTNTALSPRHSSSLHLLSPLNIIRVADKKASEAEKVFWECGQEGPIPFSHYLSTEKLERCEKIGEGVFGEVFQMIVDRKPVALKIIAIEGSDLVNGSHQKTFEEILPEIIISKELSLLSDEAYNRTEGFIGLNSVHCVQGPYPLLLLKAWDHYNSTKKSANDRPDYFEESQLFIVLEFEFGGIDLEQMKTKLSSVATAKSIIHQITASLAVAEASLRFEHRDLHWGNVLLKKTSHKELRYTLNGKTNTIPTRGLQVNIIDYTLSRLERDGIVVFCDISMDEELFTGEGDYQYEIYRLMRKENNNCWGEYHPYNNVLWLHYLTDKILNEMTFKTKCNTTAMKQMKRKIQHFHRTVLNFTSATDLLCQHSLFK
ncbi:serine/threonine-protein kinase haspin [Ictidomys tridecemlineatus]|uniref:serine/threonine-protein kinase haspin n=1 Tax=Ictidomys tridecemlineatus TaxID=43179 RepID=UPI00038C0FE7|nr:serine/threonine-protein kinase haspin [Ictidomys tridecemlineatus]KAG3270160.1 histone H3 associated protein kinase [Ictidomys tridecemlineatus]